VISGAFVGAALIASMLEAGVARRARKERNPASPKSNVQEVLTDGEMLRELLRKVEDIDEYLSTTRKPAMAAGDGKVVPLNPLQNPINPPSCNSP